MKTIAVSGGKGGTGKSTVAILLAKYFVSQKKKVILADLDVECPNDYLLLSKKLASPVKQSYTDFPSLDKKKCQKCGLCVKKCRSQAIFQAPGQYPIFIKNLCSGCGLCSYICPYQAIKIIKEETGQVFVNKINNYFYLITGQAKAGLEETGPVVRETKEFVVKFAKEKNIDLIILDTAAGLHCPVINALLGVDLVYLVTEPTPMGAYDLAQILKLCQKLKVKSKIILNQADLGNKKLIYNLAKKFNKKIIKEIPYSEEIAKAYSWGKLSNLNFFYVK